MDEVNVVIQSVLPVQQSLPPQKEKGLEVQSKMKILHSMRTMRMENKTAANGEMKREEAPKEEKKIIFFLKIGNGRRTYCKERRKRRQNSCY